MLPERQCCAQLCPVQATTMPPKNACLLERKWWCFLLSSVFTFLAGLLIVLLWRFFAFLFTRKQPAELATPGCPNSEPKKETKRQGKQEFEGTFMTEAKDWAGELISGQTTTGRILVRRRHFLRIRLALTFTRTPYGIGSFNFNFNSTNISTAVEYHSRVPPNVPLSPYRL